MQNVLHQLKALADRNRLRAVAALMVEQELCACQLTELLGVSGATASRHLDLLVRAGLLKSRKEGRWVYFLLGDRLAGDNDLSLWLRSELKTDREVRADRARLKKITRLPKETLCRQQRGESCC